MIRGLPSEDGDETGVLESVRFAVNQVGTRWAKSNEEETELLLLIDVCVEECIGMTGGETDRQLGTLGNANACQNTSYHSSSSARFETRAWREYAAHVDICLDGQGGVR